MNHAAFLAVLVVMSFGLPLLSRFIPMLNPNLFTLLSVLFVLTIGIQLWQKHKLRQTLKTLNEDTSEFSSARLKSLNPEEDIHASL